MILVAVLALLLLVADHGLRGCRFLQEGIVFNSVQEVTTNSRPVQLLNRRARCRSGR